MYDLVDGDVTHTVLPGQSTKRRITKVVPSTDLGSLCRRELCFSPERVALFQQLLDEHRGDALGHNYRVLSSAGTAGLGPIGLPNFLWNAVPIA